MPKRCGCKTLELVCFQRSGKLLWEEGLMNPMNLADFSHGWWFSTSCQVRMAFFHVSYELWISFKKYSVSARRSLASPSSILGRTSVLRGSPLSHPSEKPCLARLPQKWPAKS
jgi:hypothetical protein